MRLNRHDQRPATGLEHLEPRTLFSAVNLIDFMPLQVGMAWHYNDTDTRGSYLETKQVTETRNLHGYDSFAIQTAYNQLYDHTEFFSVDAGGWRYQGKENPTIGMTEDAPAVRFLPAVVDLGTSYPMSGTFSGHSTTSSWTGTASGAYTVGPTLVSVTVPAGTFMALTVQSQVHVTEVSAGVTTSSDHTETRWFVQGLGMVKYTYSDTSGYSGSNVLAAAPTQTIAFVNRLYNDALLRPADTASLNFWTAVIASNVQTPSNVANLFMNSTEARTNAIQNLYQTILGRPADTGGLNFWLGYMSAGHIIEDIKSGFYGSLEYAHAHSDSNTLVVQSYYQAFLDRTAEPEGLNFWSGLLDHGTANAAVARSIMTMSTEGAGMVATHAYTAYLRRNPDAGGLDYWTGRIKGGASEMQIVAGFLGSTEYYNLTS